MGPIRRAVIDVGTNSVKLLVADLAGHAIQPLIEQSQQTRLGHGFYETRLLKPQAIAATAQAVADFAAIARESRAASIRVIATSAAREALNREMLIAAIEHTSGLKTEVISGDLEAEWGFLGVTTDPQLARTPLLLMDVGGGSTQFVFGRSGQVSFRHSFPLGTVRLMETIPCSDPPKPSELAACRQSLKAFLQTELFPKLSANLSSRITHHASRPPLLSGSQLVGVGGTATILGCMENHLQTFDRARLEATRLSADRLTWHLNRLWNLTLKERQTIVGLPRNRADVILMGVAVYYAVIEEFHFPDLRLSTRGLRFAALMQRSHEPPPTPSPRQPGS